MENLNERENSIESIKIAEPIKEEIKSEATETQINIKTDSNEQKTQEPTDRHGVVDPITPIGEIDVTKPQGDEIPSPSANGKELNEFFNTISSVSKNNKAIGEHYDEKDASLVYQNGKTYDYVLKDSITSDLINDNLDNYVNNINYANKNMDSRVINFASGKGVMSGTAAISRLRSAMRLGDIIQIPLWHSGFWITINPPTQKEIVQIENMIATNFIELGRSTNTFVYSNNSIIWDRVIVDFTIDHLIEHSLALPEGEDIRDYINVNDMPMLTLGIIASMNPKGLKIAKTCRNTIKLDENNKPSCDFVLKATLDPKKLIWVNRTCLTNKMLDHMANRTANSVSALSVKDYQLSINKLVDQCVELTSESGQTIKITFSLPTLKNHIVNGEKWVLNIVTDAEKLYTETDTEDEKNMKINKMAYSNILGMYSTYVKKIEILNDNEETIVINDPDTIEASLSEISSDNELLNKFLEEIIKYVANTAIAIVAVPNYICPKCKEKQMSHTNKAFNELIPLNLVEHFLVLFSFRAGQMRRIAL